MLLESAFQQALRLQYTVFAEQNINKSKQHPPKTIKMTPRVFVTGATGYIGGHTTGELIAAHPEYQVVTLVRNEEQAAKLQSHWPTITTVIGTLDDDKVIKEESAKASVVLRKWTSCLIQNKTNISTRARKLRPHPRCEVCHRWTGNWRGQIDSRLWYRSSQRYVYWPW